MKRIGVIGVGYLGQHHVRILSEFKDVRLSGISDINLERAEEIGRLYGCPVFEDYRELLDRVDAVSIVTPTVTHFEISREALLREKDLFVEKPLTHDLAEAEELVRLAKEKKRILQVGHLERYNPAYRKAKEIIGDILYIIAERLSPFTGRGADVDITFDLMIHDLDLVVDLIGGEVIVGDLHSHGLSLVTDKIDFATVWLDFSVTKVLLFSSRISTDKRRTLTLFCNDYYLIADLMAQTLRRVRPAGQGRLISEDISVEKSEPLKEELRDFVDCINSRRPPLVSGEDILYPLSLAVKITEQIRWRGNSLGGFKG